MEEGRDPKVPQSKSPKVQGPRYLKVTFKYELDSTEGTSCSDILVRQALPNSRFQALKFCQKLLPQNLVVFSLPWTQQGHCYDQKFAKPLLAALTGVIKIYCDLYQQFSKSLYLDFFHHTYCLLTITEMLLHLKIKGINLALHVTNDNFSQ